MIDLNLILLILMIKIAASPLLFHTFILLFKQLIFFIWRREVQTLTLISDRWVLFPFTKFSSREKERRENKDALESFCFYSLTCMQVGRDGYFTSPCFEHTVLHCVALYTLISELCRSSPYSCWVKWSFLHTSGAWPSQSWISSPGRPSPTLPSNPDSPVSFMILISLLLIFFHIITYTILLLTDSQRLIYFME